MSNELLNQNLPEEKEGVPMSKAEFLQEVKNSLEQEITEGKEKIKSLAITSKSIEKITKIYEDNNWDISKPIGAILVEHEELIKNQLLTNEGNKEELKETIKKIKKLEKLEKQLDEI